MDILSNLYDQQLYYSKIFSDYFEDVNIAFMDIETTGLYPSSDNLILGGILTADCTSLKVTQYFAKTKGQEKEVLLAYHDALSQADMLITYNGNRFDLPFLNHRFRKYELNKKISTSQSFDLYRILHNYSNFREFLPDLKQKTVESFLGISSAREDEISGFQSVQLYKKYIETGSEEIKNLILLHNRDDLLQLSRLLCVLNKLDLHKILYHEGFPVLYKNRKVFINSIKFDKSSLKISADTCNLSNNHHSFKADYQIIHNQNTSSLTVEIPLRTLHNANYVDLENLPFDLSLLNKLPAYVNGYLILRENTQTNYLAINYFVKQFLKEIIKHI